MRTNRVKFFAIIVLAIFLIVISIASYLAFQFNNTNSEETLINPNNLSCFSSTPTVSFEIDDITFAQDQTATLQNALFLAKKYNITFDLGVMAFPFSENMDNNTFAIYQNNKDIFEIIAHGYTHGLDQSLVDQTPVGSYGEFYIFLTNQTSKGINGEGIPLGNQTHGLKVPMPIQDYHIKKMNEIFQSYNLTTALEIFTLPYHTGDFNTTLLAEKYGYKLILQKITSPQTFSEIKFGNIIDTQDYIDVAQSNNLSGRDVINYTYLLNKAVSMSQTRIDISLHPINFQSLSNIDNFFNSIIVSNPEVSYNVLSNRFNCV